MGHQNLIARQISDLREPCLRSTESRKLGDEAASFDFSRLAGCILSLATWPRAGAHRLAAAGRRSQAQEPATLVESWGSPVLDRSPAPVVKMGERAGGRAAMLAGVPMGESPIGGDCPVTTVVISDRGKGDRPGGKLGSKSPRRLGASLVRSARGTSNSTGRRKSEPGKPPKSRYPSEAADGHIWECRAVGHSVQGRCHWRRTGHMQPTNSPGSKRTACREGATSESTDPVASCLGVVV